MMHSKLRRFGILSAAIVGLLGTMFAGIDVVSANASSVTQPMVSPSSSSAGASAVTYVMDFTTGATGAIPAGGTITLAGPPGTH